MRENEIKRRKKEKINFALASSLLIALTLYVIILNEPYCLRIVKESNGKFIYVIKVYLYNLCGSCTAFPTVTSVYKNKYQRDSHVSIYIDD